MTSRTDRHRSRPDVTIVGAGPAGSTLALLLARAGIAVELVDRRRFPRDKVCGDFLNPRCVAALARLDLLENVLSEAGLRIEGMRLFSRQGRVVEARYDLLPDVAPGIGIRRARLDALLVEHAIGAGARFRAATIGDPRAIRSALVVGADGRGSRVARAFGIGLPTGRAGGYALRGYAPAGPILGAFGEIHLTDYGYVGLGPVGGGHVNAAIVVKDGSRRDLAHELASLPSLAGKLDVAALTNVRAAAPLRHSPCAVVDGRALLVGDAAMTLDPVTGEGVYHAVRSAELAAPVVVAALAPGGDPSRSLRTYARAHAAEFDERRRVSRIIQLVLPRSLSTEALGRLLPLSPALTARLLGYAGNAITLGGTLRWRPITSGGDAASPRPGSRT